METAAQAEEFEQALAAGERSGHEGRRLHGRGRRAHATQAGVRAGAVAGAAQAAGGAEPAAVPEAGAAAGRARVGPAAMEIAAQAEEFEQALAAANELGTKADAYTAEVEELTQLSSSTSRRSHRCSPSCRRHPSRRRSTSWRAAGRARRRASRRWRPRRRAEEFEQALPRRTIWARRQMPTRPRSRSSAQLKQQYEQELAQVQPKLQAAPIPSPFKKLDAAAVRALVGPAADGDRGAGARSSSRHCSRPTIWAQGRRIHRRGRRTAADSSRSTSRRCSQVQPKLQAAPRRVRSRSWPAAGRALVGQQPMETAAQARGIRASAPSGQ